MKRQDTQDPETWLGRMQREVEDITAAPLQGLWATLDREGRLALPGQDAPPLSHWLFFTPKVPQASIGVDGHPARGGFLPPISLPRRMWAGGTLLFHHPLRVGDEVQRESRVMDVSEKDGRSGRLAFVTVRHELTNANGLAITENQDIVYREAALVGSPQPAGKAAPKDETFKRRVTPDPVQLFRFSALTFNAHRIHYDREYATHVEGYPGLVVHGPFIATLLLDLLNRQEPGATIRRFTFKAVGPLFDTHPFELCGRPDGARKFALWARNHEGALAMEASAEID